MVIKCWVWRKRKMEQNTIRDEASSYIAKLLVTATLCVEQVLPRCCRILASSSRYHRTKAPFTDYHFGTLGLPYSCLIRASSAAAVSTTTDDEPVTFYDSAVFVVQLPCMLHGMCSAAPSSAASRKRQTSIRCRNQNQRTLYSQPSCLRTNSTSSSPAVRPSFGASHIVLRRYARFLASSRA